jgi:hypothetical protein
MHHSQCLEVAFSEGVQHRPRFCLDHFNCIRTVAFQFYLQLGKQKKVQWVGATVMLVWSKIPCEKGSVRQWVVVMQQRVFFVAKVRGEVFAHFQDVAVIVAVVWAIDWQTALLLQFTLGNISAYFHLKTFPNLDSEGSWRWCITLNRWVSGLHPLSGILKTKKKTQRFGKSKFSPRVRGREREIYTPTLLAP